MKSCRVCLDLDTAVTHVGNSEAVQHLQDILRNHGFEELSSEHYICFMCKYLLDKYFSFVKRILRAQQAFRETKNQTINAKFINLDRYKLNLNLNLSCHSITNFYYGSKVEDCNDNVDVSIKEEISYDNLSDNPITLNLLDIPINSKTHVEDEERDKDKENINEDSDDSKSILILKKEKYEIIKEEISYDNLSDNPITLNLLDIPINSKTHVEDEERDKDKENINEDSDASKSILILKKYEINKSRKNSKKRIKKNNVILAKKKPKDSDEDYNPEYDSAGSRSSNEYFAYAGRVARRDYRVFPMYCQECDAVIESRKHHHRHYRLYHQGIEYPYGFKSNFVCQHCGVTRTTIYHLREHEKTHGEKNFKCEECGKKFYTNGFLLKHQIFHRKKYAYICDYCNKGFHHRTDVTLHLRTHTGEKPFKCHLCDARFAHKGNIGIHIRINHQQAPRIPSSKVNSKPKKRKGGQEDGAKKKTKRNKEGAKKKSNIKVLKKKSTNKHIKKKFDKTAVTP